MVCDRSDFRLAAAKRLGFAVCNNDRDDFAAAAVDTLHSAVPDRNTTDIDCFLDAAGAGSILELFMSLGKIGSRFVSVAVNNALRSLDLLHLTFAQKSIIGSGGYMPEDVRDVMNIMESGRWDLESMITHEFPLDQIETAIKTAADTEHALNVTIKL